MKRPSRYQHKSVYWFAVKLQSVVANSSWNNENQPMIIRTVSDFSNETDSDLA